MSIIAIIWNIISNFEWHFFVFHMELFELAVGEWGGGAHAYVGHPLGPCAGFGEGASSNKLDLIAFKNCRAKKNPLMISCKYWPTAIMYNVYTHTTYQRLPIVIQKYIPHIYDGSDVPYLTYIPRKEAYLATALNIKENVLQMT